MKTISFIKTTYLRRWKFHFDSGEEFQHPDLDDRDWQDVTVPHDWAVSFPFSKSNSSGTGYLPGGTAWYRTSFSISPEEQENQFFIRFDGVYKNSQVWCNGYYLGGRPSGYSGFSFDISHCLSHKAPNIIIVKVHHEDIADSRWYTGSGIYRKVSIQSHDRLFIPQESVVVQSEIAADCAMIRISAQVCNTRKTAADSIRIMASLTGTPDAVYCAETWISALAPGSALPLELKIAVPAPRLWSPEEPSLYTLSLEVEANGEHRFTAMPLKIGIRSIRFDPDQGFFLNGASHKIKGVCVHHDAGCLGAAVWSDVWQRRLLKLKNMGCNAIRMSHNPHMPELYDLCDTLGFFVMEEAFDEWEGCKNKWTHGHNVYPPAHQGYYEVFPEWHERDLAAMVIRGRNHPCIIFWSIGNEIDYPNDPYGHPLFQEMVGNNDANKPKTELRYNPNKPNMERLSTIARDLVRIVKRYDQTRPVLAAAAFPELSSRLGFLDALDIAGYNYKEHLYEEDRRRFPKLPILGSENHHSLGAWKAVRDNPAISAQFLWTGIDYLGEAQGWPIRGSGAGLLDLAGNEKIAYFRRKVLWKDEPILYLATTLENQKPEMQPWELFRSWNYVQGALVRVVCYTNLEQAELFCNDTSYGIKTRSEDQEYLSWTVPFERGILRVSGRGTEDTLESTLPGVQIRLRLWEGETDPIPADTLRLRQVEIEIVDEKDRLCTTENPLVTVALTGSGKLLGLENGDLADCTEYAAPRRRAYRGRLIAYILSDSAAKEETSVCVSAEGYSPALLTL
jgi:hypothetical protein